MQGVPVRFDPQAIQARTLRTFTRAVATMARAKLTKQKPEALIRQMYPDDDHVGHMMKAVSTPASTNTFWQAVPSRILPALIPASAAGRLMERGNTITLEGVYQIKIPRILQSGRPTAVFVAEGGPIPVVDARSSAYLLGPSKKVSCIATLSHEIEWASGETASQIVAEALSISVTQSIDAQMFSTNAASAAAPAGLLNGLTALTSGGTTGADGLADDLAKLASAIAAQGINPDDAVIVCSAFNAFKIKVLASPKLTNEVLTALHIADDTVIMVVPAAYWTAFPDTNVQVEINANASALAQFDDSAPAADPLTAPSRSLWQAGLIGVKVRADVTWAINPGGVAYLTGPRGKEEVIKMLSKDEKVRILAEARETLRRTDPKLSGMPEPTCRPDTNAEVQRRLRKLEEQCATPKPCPLAPPTEAENARRFKRMIDKVANAERQFILDVIAGALAEVTEEVAEEAAENAASLINPIEQQMVELKTMFAQLLTNVAMMQATVIREHGAIQDLPELPKMKDIN